MTVFTNIHAFPYSHLDRSATLIGAPYHTDNLYPWVLGRIDPSVDSVECPDEVDSFTANGRARCQEMVRRFDQTWATQPSFSENFLCSIDRPVLSTRTDRGQFLPPALFEHEANAIPDPENLYLPEGRHAVIRERPQQSAHGIQAFVEQVIEGGAR